MPRRNLHCLFLITLCSLVCYQKVPASRYSRVLADAMDRVSRRFYQPVNELDLFEGAMSGMIDRLGDENSRYIKAAKKQAFEQDISQPDTVQGDSRGADGQWDFLLPGGRRTGYIRVTGFSEAEQGQRGTVGEFRAALERLGEEKIRGLVLDLRDDRGGSLTAAVGICDMLVPQGEIVTMRGRDGHVLRAFSASGKAPFTGFPIAVLVNRSTASASEIVAACLQDHHRGIVVGQRSYGKGTVQEVLDLGQACGAMKLTIATYWRPSGQNINRPKEDAKGNAKNAAWGVSPDEGYDLTVEDDERDRLLAWQQAHESVASGGGKGTAGQPVPDRVLLKAVEYLESTAEK
jgi:carboxyl-terminal processing protease